MFIVRGGAALSAIGLLTVSVPTSAQFFLQAKDLSGAPVVGNEPGVGLPMPEATPVELEAGLIWNMRAALNVAALQCQFEPTLLTVTNYNTILTDHKVELKASFDTLSKYFNRINKSVKAGQSALDQFGTRTYSAFATVAAQRNFCQTANAIGRDAVFAPRGSFGRIARERSRELRNSLVPWGEQGLVFSIYPRVTTPRFDAICWSKKGDWNTKKCGAQTWSTPGVGVAAAM